MFSGASTWRGIFLLCDFLESAMTFNGGSIVDRTMTSREYDLFKAAIEAANDSQDKDALRQILKQLVANYGMDNDDVQRLIKMFRYSV